MLSLPPAAVGIDSLERRYRLPVTDPIEGIWLMTDGATLAHIEPYDHPSAGRCFVIRAIDAADRTIAPGTVIGIATTAASDSYDAALVLNPSATEHNLSKAAAGRFTLRFNPDGTLSFTPAENRLVLSPHLMLPFFLRRAVTTDDQRHNDHIDGAIRLTPPTPAHITGRQKRHL